jgi:hypothetical protein
MAFLDAEQWGKLAIGTAWRPRKRMHQWPCLRSSSTCSGMNNDNVASALDRIKGGIALRSVE